MTAIASIQTAPEIIGKISSSERGLFVGVMIAFLVFSGFFMWQSNESKEYALQIHQIYQTS